MTPVAHRSGAHADLANAELLDISIPYSSGTPGWPGDVAFSCGWTARREDGSSVNLGAITTSTHAGTHADAPLHVHSAWGASESLDVTAFVGECAVIVLPESMVPDAAISVVQLQSLIRSQIASQIAATHPDVSHVPARVLLCTGHSVAMGTFPAAWPVLEEQTADWLIANGVRLVGTDAPSVDARDSKILPVHHCLFRGGAYVLENVALSGISPGRYELLAQPLAIVGADAAPVRALLRRL